jgi:hypothetical protein
MNSHIEELPFSTLFPDDEAGIAGALAVDHDLGWADSSRFGDVPQTDRDAYHWLGKVHQRRLPHDDGEIVG